MVLYQMKFYQKFAVIVGRIFLAAIFLIQGVNKIMDWQGANEYLKNVFTTWMQYSDLIWVQGFVQIFLPWVPLLLILAISFELLGGFFLFFGIGERLAPSILLIFLIPTTLLIHHFWFLEGTRHELELIMFLKNVAISGGLLILLGVGKQLKERVPIPKTVLPTEEK